MKKKRCMGVVLFVALGLAGALVAQQPEDEPKDVGAALASGRILAASRLAKENLRRTENKDLDLLFQAAEVAAMGGENSLALSRFRTFAMQSTEKGPRMQKALSYVLGRGVYLEGLGKYLELLGADERGWQWGTSFMDRMFFDDVPDQAVEAAELLFKYYASDAAKMDYLARRLADNERYMGKDEALRKRLLQMALSMQVSDLSQLERMLNTCWSMLTAEERFVSILRVQKTANRPLPGTMFRWFGEMNNLPEDRREVAGRSFLAFEPIYRDKGSALDYRQFVWQLLVLPGVFHVQGKELVNDAQVQQRVDALVARLKDRGDARDQLRDPFVYIDRNYLADKTMQAALLQKYIGLLHIDRFRELVQYTEGKQLDAQVALWAQGKRAPEVAYLKYRILDWYNRTQNKDGLITAARESMLALTDAWDPNYIDLHFMNSALPSDDEKVVVLNAIHAAEGSSKALRTLIAKVEKGKKNTLSEHAGFNALKAAVAQDKPAGEPVRRAYFTLKEMKQNQKNPSPDVYATVEAFLKAYKGKVPGNASDAATNEENMANRLLALHAGHLYHNGTETAKAAGLWAPRITSTGATFDSFMSRASGSHAGTWTAAKRYAALIKQGQPVSSAAIGWMGNGCPKGEAVSLFDGMYDKLGDGALAWLNRHMHTSGPQYSRWPGGFYIGEVAKVMALPNTQFSKADVALCIQLIQGHTTAEIQAPEPLVAALTDRLLATTPTAVDGLSLARLYSSFSRSNRPEAARRWLDALAPKLQARPAYDRANAMLQIAGSGELRNMDNRAHILLNVVKPLIDGLAPIERSNIMIDYTVLRQCRLLASQNEDVERKAAGQALFLQLAELAVTDGQISGDRYAFSEDLQVALLDMIDRGAWPGVLQSLNAYTAAVVVLTDWPRCWRERIEAVVKALEEKEGHEALFTFVSLLQARVTGGREEAMKQLLAIKSRAARNIPGLLPVDKRDPTYDLYLAAQMLDLGSETRAWELTQPKQELLRKRWVSFDPAYVAWAIDGMRKQNLYKEALEFAFTVLMKEMDYDAELMARVSLTKGDIYRDQENFQAARIEYQGLIDRSRYKRTEAGLDARYRLIDLMIQTKDYASADARLQRLVDAGSLREQAEAYYLYAKMAFEQKEYVLSRDHLQDVFRREHGHIQGRLLEGELRLILPRGLASTEVPIGRLDLQTVAVPGRELTLKLQDRNLAIARGGKSIPVVVTTTRGGDEELMKLLVSADDDSLFVGTIATRLGDAKKNNMVLEVGGDEHVSYQMDTTFQKENDLHYPPKLLLVKSDAELAASAGEILSREARDKLEMEHRIVQRGQQDSNAWQRQRRDALVRPGSPIYLQVTDLDRDVSGQPDKVMVDIETSSGDILTGVPLTETGPHTGIFMATVPTTVPYPMVTASDTEEGKDPNSIINNTRSELWTSVADGKLGKWVEVDTMSSYGVKSAALETPDVGRIRHIRLLGSLEENLEFLAEFPESAEVIEGGLLVEMGDGSDTAVDRIRNTLHRRVTHSSVLPQPSFYRADTEIGKRNGWYVMRMSGTFWLPENRYLELKFLQPVSPSNWQYAYLFLDDKYIMGGLADARLTSKSVKLLLTRGAHRLEVLSRDHWSESRVVIGYRQEDGQFAPLPAEWFSTTAQPDLAALLRPRAKISRTETGFAAEMDKPQRLRRLRWVFEDFDEQGLSVSAMRVVDETGKMVIPTASDFSMGRANRVLEVAAGDRIEITYADELRIDANTPVKIARLGASFQNAGVQLQYEEIVTGPMGEMMRPVYMTAKRVRRGDQLMLSVTDYDEDQSPERDIVEVTVSTSSGESLVMKALETEPTGEAAGGPSHSGIFRQILKFGQVTQGNTIKLNIGDTVQVSYLDRENTNPGVPFERTCTVKDAGDLPPSLDLYRTRIEQVEDFSPVAQLKAERLRRQGLQAEDIHLYTDLVVGELSPAEDGETSLPVSVRGPIMIEALHPSEARHASSRCTVIAMAESERVAAAAEGREPTTLSIPLTLSDLSSVARKKGFAVRLSGRAPQPGTTLLSEGRFSGVMRLQLGSPGDEPDDRVHTDAASFAAPDSSGRRSGDRDEFRVPTLVVAGNDKVHLSIRDEAGKVLCQRQVHLLSDAQMQLMDRTYSVPVSAIHLGQKFYVQVTDPDRDASDQRESVDMAVVVKDGDAMTLTLQETLPHSGVFSGTLEPTFVSKDEQGNTLPPDRTDDTLQVQFGQTVSFSYTDPTSLSVAGETNVVVIGKIYQGADARLASFTKQFKDPEMAVKTRFLLAEALFEMAKDHRKLERMEESEDEIAEGKRILEEAMRDYPDTSLVSQGEFLLANLAQELENYNEAIGRYSRVISSWPDSEYASRSQFKKAICLEKMDHYEQSCEEYVKLTYLYPNSPLVADATVRLGNYYYTREKYDTAGRIFERFQERNPEHELATKALFLAGQSYVKMENAKEDGADGRPAVRDYVDAIVAFRRLVENYPDDNVVRPEAMYWLGDSYFRNAEHVKAYQTFKKLTWDYPATKWAKIARGRLTEEAFVTIELKN